MLRPGSRRWPRLRIAWLALAAGTLPGLPPGGTAAASPEASPRSVAAGPHFQVTCHFEHDGVATAALAAVEAVWPRAVEVFGPPPAEALPLRVHLYRTGADYHRAEAALTGGAFRENLAFAHHESRTAHVALQPDLGDTALRAVGLPAQTRRLLAHEATHLVRYAAMADYRAHPGWFADGAALWAADRTLRDLGVSPGLAEDPLTSTWIVQARRALDRGPPDLVARTLADDAGDLSMHARYAVRGLLFTWFAEGPRRADLDRFLARVRSPPGDGSPAERFRAAAEATLWPRQAGAAGEREFRTYVEAFAPQWEQGLRSLELRGREWLQIAFPDANALAWRTTPAGVPFTLEASIEILPAAHRQMNVLLGRRDDEFLVVALVAGEGVTLLRYRAAEDRWERLAHADGGGIEVGMRRRVAVTAARGSLAVEVEGAPVLRHEAPGLDASGPWGVGAYAGSAGIWSDVRVR